jgi:choline dehydrogenase-like flavoprotein
MPIYMEISPLHRLVTIVARGTVSGDEVRGTAQKLADARVRRFGKIVEVASATFEFQPPDILALAQTLRADADGRGPIAFVVRDLDQPFPRMFATQTAHEGPVDLFKSLHEARAWIARIQHAPKPAPATAVAVSKVAQAAADAWADPDRQGTVIRGTRTREFTTRELVH